MAVNDSKAVSVEFYSGARREEKPIALRVHGQRILVSEVIREDKIGCPLPEGGYHRIFEVETEDGSVWKIREAPQNACGWEVQLIPS